MAYNRKITYTTTGTKDSLNLDPSIAPFDVSITATLSGGGSISYKMQYSLDPMTTADADATWTDSTGIPASSTTSLTANLTFPVERVRFVIGSLTGSLIVQTLQGLSTN